MQFTDCEPLSCQNSWGHRYKLPPTIPDFQPFLPSRTRFFLPNRDLDLLSLTIQTTQGQSISETKIETVFYSFVFRKTIHLSLIQSISLPSTSVRLVARD